MLQHSFCLWASRLLQGELVKRTRACISSWSVCWCSASRGRKPSDRIRVPMNPGIDLADLRQNVLKRRTVLHKIRALEEPVCSGICSRGRCWQHLTVSRSRGPRATIFWPRATAAAKPRSMAPAAMLSMLLALQAMGVGGTHLRFGTLDWVRDGQRATAPPLPHLPPAHAREITRTLRQLTRPTFPLPPSVGP